MVGVLQQSCHYAAACMLSSRSSHAVLMLSRCSQSADGKPSVCSHYVERAGRPQRLHAVRRHLWPKVHPRNQRFTLLCRPVCPTARDITVCSQAIEKQALFLPRQGCVLCGTFKATYERQRIWGFISASQTEDLATSSVRAPSKMGELPRQLL